MIRSATVVLTCMVGAFDWAGSLIVVLAVIR
jgi:hypothetical protein